AIATRLFAGDHRADCQSAPWSCQRSSPVSVSTICRNSGTTYP
ncbi:hypothetical protein BFDFBN_BFDFBN_16800, partial [Dysosmobacter welbionis]